MYNHFQKLDDIEPFEVAPGIVGKIIHTDEMSLSFFDINEGAILPEHQHIHEQTSYVQEGQFQFTVNGSTKVVGAGDYIKIAPNTPHSAKALSNCKIIDVFVPCRDDYKHT